MSLQAARTELASVIESETGWQCDRRRPSTLVAGHAFVDHVPETDLIANRTANGDVSIDVYVRFVVALTDGPEAHDDLDSVVTSALIDAITAHSTAAWRSAQCRSFVQGRIPDENFAHTTLIVSLRIPI